MQATPPGKSERSRTRVTALVALAGLATVLAIVGFLTTTGSAQAATTTRVKLKVVGCEGCKLIALNWKGANQPSYGTRKIVGGVAVFNVPKAATKGLGFIIQNTAANADHQAQTVIVARYKGLIKGEPVPGYRARNGHYATQCWAGTTRDQVNLTVTVKHFPTTSIDGSAVNDAIRAYFNPTVASIGTPWATWNGGLYTQSVINCSGVYPG